MAHHRSIYPQSTFFEPGRDTENLLVSFAIAIKNCAFFEREIEFQLPFFKLVQRNLKSCMQIAPEDICLRTVFDSDYFWLK